MERIDPYSLAILGVLVFVTLIGWLSIARELFVESPEKIYGDDIAKALASREYMTLRILVIILSLVALIIYVFFDRGVLFSGFILILSFVYMSQGIFAYLKTGIIIGRLGNTYFLPVIMIILGVILLFLTVARGGVHRWA